MVHLWGTNVMWHMHSDEPQIQQLIGLKRLVITQYGTCECSAVCMLVCVCSAEGVNIHYYPSKLYYYSNSCIKEGLFVCLFVYFVLENLFFFCPLPI